MPKPTKGPRLGGGPAHERLLLANLAAALFTHKSIKTTETKAKRLRPVAERLITFAKRGDLHARRRVLGVIGDKTVVHELFTQIAPLVEFREGGYTRITKLGFRKGDNASMVQIELVLEPVNARPKAKADTRAPAVPAVATESVTDDAAPDDTIPDGAVESPDDAADQSVDDTVDQPIGDVVDPGPTDASVSTGAAGVSTGADASVSTGAAGVSTGAAAPGSVETGTPDSSTGAAVPGSSSAPAAVRADTASADTVTSDQAGVDEQAGGAEPAK